MIKDIPIAEQPREKALRYGVKTLSTQELLALLIRCGASGRSSMELAQDVLRVCGGLGELPLVALEDLMRIKGIKQAKALELIAVFELAKRCLAQRVEQADVIASPQDLCQWMRLQAGCYQQEHFLAVYLNTHNRVLTYREVFVGGLDRTMVHPREIFKEACRVSAAKWIAAHNHPSGDVEPSMADLALTEQLQKAGDLLGIPLLDHIVVSHRGYFSFKEHKLL